jgi:hypothetical protein
LKETRLARLRIRASLVREIRHVFDRRREVRTRLQFELMVLGAVDVGNPARVLPFVARLRFEGDGKRT